MAKAATPSSPPHTGTKPEAEALADALPVANLAETLPMVRPPPSVAGREAEDRAYLVVFEENTALTFPLPKSGEVVIGRSPDVALPLGDRSASRQHATLSIRSGEVFLSDLGSRNGTRVNGELITGQHPLIAGDVITICKASLIFYRQAAATSEASIYTVPQLRQRMGEEIDRSLRYHRPVSFLALWVDPTKSDHATLLAAIASHLRRMDGVAWLGSTQLLVLLPELTVDEVSSTAEQMLSALAALEVESRAGFAVCPTDGSDVDTLLSGAHAAASTAQPRSPAVRAAETATTLTIGDRRIVLADPTMLQMYALIEKLAPSELPVLIQGETGVGKEFAASTLHHKSKRQGRPFVSVNCAALPESLIESELFGHERGAFSGAVAAKTGLLEAANTGTIFLDEIGELSLSIQAKLLRVLETQRLMRVGEVRERAIDVRIVAATNRDLATEITAGRFRKDLYFRLGAARLTLPPLRDRRRELPVLVRALLADACTRLQREQIEVSAAAMVRLQTYPWPGNVRELRNLMEFVAATVEGSVLLPWHFEEQLAVVEQPAADAAPQRAQTKFRSIEDELRDVERQRMLEALTAAGGVHVRAAELISMPIRTFTAKLKQYQLGSRKAPSGA
jgi:DNA-binding NtrC family response regulator